MILDFLREYWREIFSVIILVASLVICCIKKKPVQVVDTLKETIIRLLPYCINKAEGQPKGEKLAACLAILADLLNSMDLPFTETDKKFATEQVEVILSTPQKKGVK